MSNVQRFGSYFLLKKIATGGMAELYKAKKSGEKGFEKLLAIKMILPHMSTNEDFVTMFVDEAKVAALLNHQNIVQIFDLGKIENSYCIVMEYIRGKDLRTVIGRGLKAGRKLSVPDVCFVEASLLAGLSYAHRKKDKGRGLNIVHRDVSPQNVIVSYEGEVKIVDFGIAKAATQSRDTKVGVLKGKIAYMSPEQARGRPLDMRSDIFSAGVVFYEMLTGKKLFQGDTDLHTLEKVREAKVEPLPTSLNKEVPQELEAILLKSLAAEPEKRFQGAAEMEEALNALMRKLGWTANNYSLGQYMSSLFKDDLEGELKEEEGLDSSLVQAAATETIATAPLPAIELKPETATNAAPTVPSASSPTRVAHTPGPDKKPTPPKQVPKNQVSRDVHKGVPGWQKALVAVLVLLAGGGLLYKFKQAGKTPAQEPPPAASAPAPPVAPAEPAPAPAATPAKTPAPAEPIKQPEKAHALVLSEPPGADVYIDGRHVGVTPVDIEGPPGRHKIRVAKDGFESWADAVHTGPGETKTVKADLRELGFALSVNSTPSGARIYIDGEDTGKLTPAGFDGLKPGRPYKVKVAVNGYGSYEDTITPKGTKPVNISATLTQQYGSFTIDARPWFYIFVDGQEKGTTPLAGITLTAGEHSLTLVNPKLNIKRQMKLHIEPDKTTTVMINPKNDPMVKETIR